MYMRHFIHDQKRTTPYQIRIKNVKSCEQKRILKISKEKYQLTSKVKNIRITSELSVHTIKSKKAWNNIIQTVIQE
jgi:hypothetical protein